jgi:manganese-dependent inorganic pyrophosphatase
MIKVFGHQNPDTDTVCCAIIWAWYLNTHTATPATAYRLGELNNETAFVLAKWGVTVPALLESVQEDDVVTIVDTNNPAELFPNINDTTIVEIIDHHKLFGGLSSKKPPVITMRPLASTASVMCDRIRELAPQNLDTMPRDIQALVLSCILSDTLEFRSPTTTPHDKALAERMAAALDIDMHAYATEMFTAKSDISTYTDEQLVLIDSKKFPVGDKTVRVSVIETAAPQLVFARMQGITSALATLKTREPDVYETLLFIVDILKEEATALAHTPRAKDILQKTFNVEISDPSYTFPGIISRKTQIAPALAI